MAAGRTWTVLALVLMLGACGGDESVEQEPATPGTAEMTHIHGVGVDPADDSVVIATHSGLFRALPGERGSKRIGDSHQDTMGFTVLGPRRYLGSGHPDLRELRGGTPPLLGLISSRDAGRSWQRVSLLGEADFHVLRAAGDRVYGVNATDGRFLVSSDGGRSWERRSPPAAIFDLAPDPRRTEELVASTERGVHVSRDAGETWRPLAPELGGLLARTSDGTLFLVDGTGAVHRSDDGGASFEAVGEIGGRPAAFAAAGDDLYAALHTNEVKLSRDGGRTWELRVEPT